MSSTLRRRDIYDPATVAELAEKIGTPERLKMLTLLTLADIKAVNPDALTPWKAENLWRLYTATANYFDRSADITAAARVSRKAVNAIVALQPLRRREVLAFLDGLPQRYILSHSAEEVIQHFRMATRLAQEPVQLRCNRAPATTNSRSSPGTAPGCFACSLAFCTAGAWTSPRRLRSPTAAALSSTASTSKTASARWN